MHYQWYMSYNHFGFLASYVYWRENLQEFSMENQGDFLASYVRMSNLQKCRIPSEVFWKFLIFGLDAMMAMGWFIPKSSRVLICYPTKRRWLMVETGLESRFLGDLFVQKSNSTGWNPNNEGGWFRCFPFSTECFLRFLSPLSFRGTKQLLNKKEHHWIPTNSEGNKAFSSFFYLP